MNGLSVPIAPFPCRGSRMQGQDRELAQRTIDKQAKKFAELRSLLEDGNA